ncbi:MAG TPA: YciI family protein [Gammaproteobacteria bacterium]|nr:YciI family protein [Gammaproteobacteria bacterium]
MAPVRVDIAGEVAASSSAMFVVELIYKADLAQIDARMKAHMAFLRKYYAAGNFLVSGRKIPREGGIILAVGKSRADIEAIMREDPFCQHGLADFRVVEFRASQRADDVQKRLDAF